MTSNQVIELRPRDFALLLLAAGDVAVRNRARDQQADRTGLALKRRLLEELVSADPEPNEFAAFLFDVHQQLSESTGSVRSLALAVLHEWQIARSTPNWGAKLLDLAQPSPTEAVRRGQQLPG